MQGVTPKKIKQDFYLYFGGILGIMMPRLWRGPTPLLSRFRVIDIEFPQLERDKQRSPSLLRFFGNWLLYLICVDHYIMCIYIYNS
jgi:hypothetical protein